MHSAFSTRGAQRRRFVHNSVRIRESACIVQLTVDADALSRLRELVVRVGGAAFGYMRIVPARDHGKMMVSLSLRPAAVATVVQAVQRCLPAAEFCLGFGRTNAVAP